jgi:hypothetical protein
MYMLDVAVDSTVLATDTWLSQVSDCIMQIWAEQAFFRPRDRPDGMKAVLQRWPDIDARIRAVVTLIDTVGSSFANAEALSLEEYDRLIQRPLHAALPFLDATPQTARAQLGRPASDLVLTATAGR